MLAVRPLADLRPRKIKLKDKKKYGSGLFRYMYITSLKQKGLGSVLNSQTRIEVKSWIRIRSKEKIRICIKMV